MAKESIPVDLFNPGQVFACLGFLEAADILLGDAEAGFDWHDEVDARFALNARTNSNPFATVLEFLASATVRGFGPSGYKEPAKTNTRAKGGPVDSSADEEREADYLAPLEISETFPAAKAERLSLPIRLGGGNTPTVELGHWADASSRGDFKLYSGNRSALSIAKAMLAGTHAKAKKRLSERIKTRGVAQLWEEQREQLIERPFDALTPMGGSFNFDPRGAWTAIDAGYSPNEHKHRVEASPVVELLAAWGLENARPDPDEFRALRVRYAAWGTPLPPILARAALFSGVAAVPLKHFRFVLGSSGKNKVVTFAELEIGP